MRLCLIGYGARQRGLTVICNAGGNGHPNAYPLKMTMPHSNPTSLRRGSRASEAIDRYVSGQTSDVGLRLEDLPTTIFAGLEIDVVGTTTLAAVFVLDIGGPLERVR